jgi:hypothetical protein
VVTGGPASRGAFADAVISQPPSASADASNTSARSLFMTIPGAPARLGWNSVGIKKVFLFNIL